MRASYDNVVRRFGISSALIGSVHDGDRNLDRNAQNTVIMQLQGSKHKGKGSEAMPAFEATPAGWNDVHTPRAWQAETTSARKTMRRPSTTDGVPTVLEKMALLRT